MKAVFLCGGYATRLYPLTRNQPKPLLPVGGRPILDYLLEKIEEIPAIDQVFVVTNDRFYPHFKQWSGKKRPSPKIEVVNDGTKTNETRLGAIGDLVFTIRKFKIRDDLAVFAGDNLFQFDLGSFFDFAESHRPHLSLGIVDVKNRDRARSYGIVRLNGKNQILEFHEKPKDPPSTLASTGVYWLAEEGLDFLDRYIGEGHNADRLGDYVSWLVKTDRVFAYPFQGRWFDIGDLNSYREAEELFSAGQNQSRGKKGTP